MSNEWLEKLKPGDDVIVSGHYGGNVVDKVQRVTATQIVLSNDARYRKSNGRMVGTIAFNHTYLLEPMPQEVERIAHRKRFEWIAHWLRSHPPRELTPEQSQRIQDIICEEKKPDAK